MDYTIHFADLLRPHLKALRKKRGLTQAQLGAELGVGQVRIAEIEGSPGAVAVEQLVRLLSALDAALVIRDILPDLASDERGKASVVMPEAPKRASRASKPVVLKGKRRPARMKEALSSNPGATVSATPARNVLIRPKKGSW